MKVDPRYEERFESRHNGASEQQVKEMLQVIGVESVDELINQTIPAGIRLEKPLNLPEATSEFAFLQTFREIAQKNKIYRSYIGLGYYNTVTPNVIARNILENPGWYTAYTPYQAEIAQGRLEALINYQTMVMELTGMEIANASLLDEGTAAAEAMTMFHNLRKGAKKNAIKFFVDQNTFPQTIDVLKTRAQPLQIELVIDDLRNLNVQDPEIFGLYFSYPGADGGVEDLKPYIDAAHEQDVYTVVGADLMSLVLLVPPGEMGADCVVGTTQRFGIPLGFGGPHAAYFATREAFKRHIPGRIIGVSVDAKGNKGFRMALQTREQHIKRERATSNICTAQVLLAVMAGMYGVYHGPKGLKRIAGRIHGLTRLLGEGLKAMGYELVHEHYFDTLSIKCPTQKTREKIHVLSLENKMNLYYPEDPHTVQLSLDETTTLNDVQELLDIFHTASPDTSLPELETFFNEGEIEIKWPEALQRKSRYLEHEVFNIFHSEHDMLRYLKQLENKDLSLVHSMISLGSCTMKLNATTEMIPLSWPEFSQIHPFVPASQSIGYREMFIELERCLTEITGFAATSLQPNSGAQGEYSGLMVIRAYHQSRGDRNRNITIIPSSAHGTNPASAVMAGMNVVIVKCDDKGNIDVEDLRQKAEANKENLAALMVTYPSTHGVFEPQIKEICQIIHDNGGQVYMDGANMNAQVGLTSPANIGADVCHLNLHKTFCIPHGGGGPGVGPICVAEHLKEFLPGNPLVRTGGDNAISAISAAPWGSASILTISYAYITLMGPVGLRHATERAIVNANYIKEKLGDIYPVLYTGVNGRAAHELIIDCRAFKSVGIEVEDIAKRLMDYGYHAPTVSFPVPGTMMIEPTESESRDELDRFIAAFRSIREEIREIEEGKADPKNNVLKNAPHTAEVITNDVWDLPYTRKQAAYPLDIPFHKKFWPTIGRIDNAYGDRNLMCSCIPISEYEDAEMMPS